MPRKTLFALIVTLSAIFGVRSLIAQTPQSGLVTETVGRAMVIGLSKNGQGAVHLGERTEYACHFGEREIRMVSLPAELNFEIGSHEGDCDELHDLFNGRLNARWELLARRGEAPFGTVSGRFSWAQEHNKAVGTMVGTLGCGTHRPPVAECEHCRKANHFEGVLNGEIIDGRLKGSRIRASYAGNLEFRPDSIRARIALDGGYVVPCPEH